MVACLGPQRLKVRLQREQESVPVSKVAQLVLPGGKRHGPHDVGLNIPFKPAIRRFEQYKCWGRPANQILRQSIETLAVQFAGINQIEFDLRMKFGVDKSHHVQHFWR